MDSINCRPLLEETEGSESEDFLDNDYNSQTQHSNHNNKIASNYENSDTDLVKFSQNIPSDKYNYNYIIFYLLGMTTLIPWNFFITAEEYWMFKFRNTTSNNTEILTPIQKDITSDLSFASAIPSTIFLILNAFVGHLIPLKIRMVGSMTVVLILFVTATGFVEINTDDWQYGFFFLTMATVAFINVFAAILCGGLFGIAGLFPSEYITAVVSGQALGGMFAALAQIVSLTFGASPKTTAFVYFIIGNLVLIISIITYLIMSKTIFFRYYVYEKCKILTHNFESINNSEIDQQTILEPNFKEVFRKIYLYAFSEWFVFTVTLAIYPAVTVLVESENHGNGYQWNDIYFTPVVNYLVFNSGDYLGRILAGAFEWPKNKPQLVLLITICRIVFIPILMLTNTNPHYFLPVMIKSDYTFIAIMVIFAISNGYVANISLIMAPKAVMQHEKEMASSIMAACLGIGLAFGSSTSLLLVQLL